MKGKDFLSVADLTADEIRQMVQNAVRMKSDGTRRVLDGKVFALIFEKPSLRTRVSFEVGIRQMGGDCIYLSKDDIGLGVREPEADGGFRSAERPAHRTRETAYRWLLSGTQRPRIPTWSYTSSTRAGPSGRRGRLRRDRRCKQCRLCRSFRVLRSRLPG